MSFVVGIIALLVGADAANKLNQPDPTPAAWFEAGITAVLIIIAVVIFFMEAREE